MTDLRVSVACVVMLLAGVWSPAPAQPAAVPVQTTTTTPAASHEWTARVAGALYAFAVADAMGGPIENWSPAEIRDRFGGHDFGRFLPPTEPVPAPGTGKGDGRITDDTLEVEALLRAYATQRGHLDAYTYVTAFLPEVAERRVWVPERQDMRTVLDRPMWWPERYAWHRHAINRVDPRQGGQGNWLNQGLATIIWPIGAVNAADPDRAYAEAVAFGSAHTESYALEGAAVVAAAFAVAFGPAPTVDAVLSAGLDRARDGTGLAMHAALAATDPADSVTGFVDAVRRAWLPFAGLPPHRLDAPDPDTRNLAGTNVGLPSRSQAVENVVAAFAAVKYGQGDFQKTLRAALSYGRDAESIAAVAVGLLGAMGGTDLVPAALRDGVDRANRRDFGATAAAFAEVVANIVDADQRVQHARVRAVRPPAQAP
jgi:ADP-ribosylglycohydrolase